MCNHVKHISNPKIWVIQFTHTHLHECITVSNWSFNSLTLCVSILSPSNHLFASFLHLDLMYVPPPYVLLSFSLSLSLSLSLSPSPPPPPGWCQCCCQAGAESSQSRGSVLRSSGVMLGSFMLIRWALPNVGHASPLSLFLSHTFTHTHTCTHTHTHTNLFTDTHTKKTDKEVCILLT